MEIGNTQKTKTLFRLVNSTERIQIWRRQHTDKTSTNYINFRRVSLWRFVTHRHNTIWISLKEEF